MAWTATTEAEAIDDGASIHIDRGYGDTPPQNGSTIALSHIGTGSVTTLTVVSSAADRLEVTDGRRNIVLKPHAVTKPNVLDADGRYREAWIVAPSL